MQVMKTVLFGSLAGVLALGIVVGKASSWVSVGSTPTGSPSPSPTATLPLYHHVYIECPGFYLYEGLVKKSPIRDGQWVLIETDAGSESILMAPNCNLHEELPKVSPQATQDISVYIQKPRPAPSTPPKPTKK